MVPFPCPFVRRKYLFRVTIIAAIIAIMHVATINPVIPIKNNELPIAVIVLLRVGKKLNGGITAPSIMIAAAPIIPNSAFLGLI